MKQSKKNLLDLPAAEEIVARVKNLKVTNAPHWGRMNASEMLLHCNLCMTQILEGDMPFAPTTLKQRVIRFLSFNVVPQFPKNLKTHHRNDTKGLVSEAEFEAQKKRFINVIETFGRHQQPIALTHPAFGTLNTRQWGLAAWMHMDHHLRQFGV
ncbi:DUF1569 domain-containing protein [Tellurirhabdus rosea]|uniref:DUF1569 domain-containing protein n=1 Tax=Tellurirhabdus rosea TaxID=2674997 RepID=UPI0022561559|nr:DUF1569 domain-containing protein [Tellurirhabdus rosea]